MQASRFNLLFDLPNGNLGLYNCRSRALIELEGDHARLVPGLLAGPGGEQTSAHPRLIEQLHYGGFLLADGEDETADLKIQNGRHRFGSSQLTLAIAPTFACNLDCPDCRGKSHQPVMSRLVEKSLLRFADRRARKTAGVQVTWFGGEPLLCPDAIERVQGALAESAARHGSELKGSQVITNGVLLDAAMARRLRTAGIHSAEVTLAGTRERHDKIRRLHDGQGSFDRILENLGEVMGILELTLRLPGNQERDNDIRELVERLGRAGLLAESRIYFAENVEHPGACTSLGGRCDQGEEELTHQLGLYRQLLEAEDFQLGYPYLLPLERCGLDAENAFIVAPTGYLFRCWQEVQFPVDLSVGGIFKDEIEPFQIANQRRYSRWDPFDRSDCTDCSLLPLCWGGCAHYVPGEHRGKCGFWRRHHQDLQQLKSSFMFREEVPDEISRPANG